MEGNLDELDFQAHTGQIVPNWNEQRQKVSFGQPEYNSIDEPVKMENGDPKSHTVRFGFHKRYDSYHKNTNKF